MTVFWKNLFTLLQVLSAVVLIGIVMSQATKSEGLSGTIGGKSESMFQGKPGFEEKLSEITKWSAITFMVLSAILTYVIK